MSLEKRRKVRKELLVLSVIFLVIAALPIWPVKHMVLEMPSFDGFGCRIWGPYGPYAVEDVTYEFHTLYSILDNGLAWSGSPIKDSDGWVHIVHWYEAELMFIQIILACMIIFYLMNKITRRNKYDKAPGYCFRAYWN